MPILVIFTGETTKDQYEALRKEVEWESNLAPGGIIHIASFDDSGHIHVADAWDSEEHLNAFVEQRLMPAFQRLNLTPPQVEVYPAYNINVYPSVSKYQI